LSHRVQGGEHFGGHATRAGTEFEHTAATGRDQHLGALPGEAAREQHRDLGRGHEVPFGAELHAAGAVIAEAWSIEDDAQVVVEAEPTAGGRQRTVHDGEHRIRMSVLVGRERRQR
jgi:hypothetical protein